MIALAEEGRLTPSAPPYGGDSELQENGESRLNTNIQALFY